MRVAAAAVIDTELGVVTAAAQTDGNLPCARSGIAVPDVWSSHTVALTVELCVVGVESKIGYIAYGYCVNAVIVKQSARRGKTTADADYSRACSGFCVEAADLYQVLVTGGRGEGNLRLSAAGVIVAID